MAPAFTSLRSKPAMVISACAPFEGYLVIPELAKFTPKNGEVAEFETIEILRLHSLSGGKSESLNSEESY